MKQAPPDAVRAAEQWFLHHGLTYFVPERRARVREALRPRRIVPFLLLVVVVGTGAGGAVAWFADQLTLGSATLASLLLLAAGWYALVQLHAGPIVRWALSRTWGSLRTLLPMTTRALPLLLLFITFLFINTEVWQVGSNLQPGALWLTVLLFVLLAFAFLLVRLPEEVDRTDDDVDDDLLLRACRGTPLEAASEALVADPDADPSARAEVVGYERWNLVIVLVIVQVVQVLLVTLSVFAFLMVFGGLIMTEPVMEAWLGHPATTVLGIPGISVELVAVATFLSAFSGLYLTVSTVTDETYREQFFGSVMAELERAVGMRAVYLTLRASAAAEAPPGGLTPEGRVPLPGPQPVRRHTTLPGGLDRAPAVADSGRDDRSSGHQHQQVRARGARGPPRRPPRADRGDRGEVRLRAERLPDARASSPGAAEPSSTTTMR